MRRPAQPASDPVGAGIVEIERRLDRLLRNQVPDEQFVRSLRSTLLEWSQAVWTSAELLGASIPASSELEHGLRLTKRPVFVCGAARSGTSLLRDLLDGHPELVVIPNESAFYTGMQRTLMRLRSDRQRSYLGRWWLERLADPPPFWLLGSSAPDASPYVAFARDLAGWWQVSERHEDARIASWPLAAFALAYAQWLGGGRLPPCARMWVEKSPGNERSLTRIWQDFPAAKVIQIVRRPEAVLASVKRMTLRRWSRRRTVTHILGQMAPAYRIAADSGRRLPEDRYCLVLYEDLTANPDAAMLRVARFLGIEPLPSLLRPTIAGRPAFNNTSFDTARLELHRVLDPIDRALLALAVARAAAKLGYVPIEATTAATHSVVGSRA
jgi:hypothetical protein